MHFERESRPFSPVPAAQAALEMFLSLPRFERYVKEAGGDRALAFRLYRWNGQLCESLYIPLHFVEVGFRNRICQAMDVRFGHSWPLLFDSPRLRTLPKPARDKIREAAEETSWGRDVTAADRIIAGLSFGFWCKMLDRRYHGVLWHRGLQPVFPNLPNGIGPEVLRDRLNTIRTFRNRVFHHEPIFTAHVRAKYHYQMMTETIAWICPLSAAVISDLSDFETVLAARPR